MGKVEANSRLPVSPLQTIILREFGNAQIVRDYQSASLSTLPRMAELVAPSMKMMVFDRCCH